jgi:hypothetical protein
VSSISASPRLQGVPRSPQNGAIIPGLVLPQAALPYRVAEVYVHLLVLELKTDHFSYCGKKKVLDLTRKPAGRDFKGGREMIIIDQDSNPRFKHRSMRPKQSFTDTRLILSQSQFHVMSIAFHTLGTGDGARIIMLWKSPSKILVPKCIQFHTKGCQLSTRFQSTSSQSARTSKTFNQNFAESIWKTHSRFGKSFLHRLQGMEKQQTNTSRSGEIMSHKNAQSRSMPARRQNLDTWNST